MYIFIKWVFKLRKFIAPVYSELVVESFFKLCKRKNILKKDQCLRHLYLPRKASFISYPCHVIFFDSPNTWMNPWMHEMVDRRWTIPCLLWFKWLDVIIWCKISFYLFMFFLGKMAKRNSTAIAIIVAGSCMSWLNCIVNAHYSKLSFSNIHQCYERKENK
jgi:hypothetical protein